MMKLEEARSGQLFATLNGKRLHSAYDPAKEAMSYVERLLGNKVPDLAVVLGPGLGYISAALQERGTLSVNIFLSDQTYTAAVDRGTACWFPDSRTDSELHAAQAAPALRSFLRSTLSETDSIGLEVLSWEPCLQAFPRMADMALELVAETVREYNANLSTTAAFGTRWFRNFCANFLSAESFVAPELSNCPVLISAAGPSLERALPHIAELKTAPFGRQMGPGRCELWAVGTALNPLNAAGIQPSLTLTTDAGYYALEHLNAARHSERGTLAAPLTAARGLTRRCSDLLLLNQSSVIEQELFRRLKTPFFTLPSNGTVAGSALELALRLRSGPIVVVGLDLGYSDILPHARPHTFEHYLWRKESRLTPSYGMMAEAALQHSRRVSGRRRTTRQLETYAAWFRHHATRVGGRVFTLGGAQAVLGFPEISHLEFKKLCDGDPQRKGSEQACTHKLSRETRRTLLAEVLQTLNTRLTRCMSLRERAEFVSLLRKGSTACAHGPHAGASVGCNPEDLQLLGFLDCRGVIRCVQQDSSAAFRRALEHSVAGSQELLRSTAQEYNL